MDDRLGFGVFLVFSEVQLQVEQRLAGDEQHEQDDGGAEDHRHETRRR